MPRHTEPRRRTFRPQGTSHTRTTEVVEPVPAAPAEAQPSAPGPAPGMPELYSWRPRQVVKVTTQMTIEHRRLMDHLTRSTGRSMWELLRDAIDHTYGPREDSEP